MKTLGTIEGCRITVNDDGSLEYMAKATIDSDGIGPHHGDHTAQNETTYKPDLNADVDRYIVVPPKIRNGVPGVVMGCQAFVTDMRNGRTTAAVVGDEGPPNKLGEISCATASAIGLNPSPVDGGEDSHVIHYRILPGVPAVVEGNTYSLQPE